MMGVGPSATLAPGLGTHEESSVSWFGRHLTASVAASVLLVGCGGGSSSSSTPPISGSGSPGPTATPSSGSPFSNARFSTVVPNGWNNKLDDQTEAAKFSNTGQLQFLVEQGPPGSVQKNLNDVNANINVVVVTQPVPDDRITAYLNSVANNGATNLSQPQSFTIDGATGSYITYDRDISGTPGESQDMIVNHGGSTYDIVLNTSKFAFQQQLPGLQAVMTAWRWKS